MNLTLTMDVDQLRRAFDKAPEIVTRRLQDWVSKSTLRAERESKLQLKAMGSSYMSGRTSNSIRTTPGFLEGETRAHTDYAQWTIEGRKPGKMPPFQPGSDLEMWARRAGINPFVVARAIGRKGTKGVPYMAEAYKNIEDKVNSDARNVIDEIVRDLL